MTSLVNYFNRVVPRKDTLEEGFVKVFAPIRAVQTILGSCRVNIRDQVVTAPTVLQKCYTIALFFASTYFGRSLILKTKIFHADAQMANMYVFGLTSLHFTFSLSVLHCRFINKGNVELYEKMQNIDRIMKINWLDSGKLTLNHYKINRASVLGLLATFSILIISGIFLTSGLVGVHEILATYWAVSTFIFEMGCCSGHIQFFIDRVNRINSIIANHLKTENIGGRPSHVLAISILSNKQQDLQLSQTDVYLNEIFSAFSCFQNQYRFQVYIFCQLCITYLVFSFQYLMTALQRNIPLSTLIPDLLATATLAALNVCMLLLLSIGSEMFLRAVNRTKRLSNSVLSRCLDGPMREKAKKMLNVIEGDPPGFSVYGMWYMDARLLLKMFGIITNAFVIILQFAFT